MRRSAVVFTVLLALCMASGIHAKTYILEIPVAGDYDFDNPTRSFSVDFGRNFKAIESLSIQWSGYVTPGWWEDLCWGISGPEPGYFIAAAKGDEGWPDYHALTPEYGEFTYPEPEGFSITSVFEPNFPEASWNFLLDGQAEFYVELGAPIRICDGASYPPIGHLDSATLILEATPGPKHRHPRPDNGHGRPETPPGLTDNQRDE